MMLVPPATFGARGTSLINTARNLALTTGLQGCYDFRDINCYPGSGQTIKDLSGQGNDIFNGNASGDTSQDMEFVGMAGRMSTGEYFERNASTGRAYLGAAVPTWMQAVHKANGKISIAQWTKTPSGTYGIGSVSDEINTSTGADIPPGFFFGVASGANGSTLGRPIFFITRADGNVDTFFQGTDTVPNTGNWMFSGCAIDAQAGTAVLQIDGTQYSGSISYSAPAATSAGTIFALGPTGADIHQKAGFLLWDRSIGASGLSAFFNATRGNFGV